MGCPELDMTSYFRLVKPAKTASRRRLPRNPKADCTWLTLDVSSSSWTAGLLEFSMGEMKT